MTKHEKKVLRLQIVYAALIFVGTFLIMFNVSDSQGLTMVEALGGFIPQFSTYWMQSAVSTVPAIAIGFGVIFPMYIYLSKSGKLPVPLRRRKDIDGQQRREIRFGLVWLFSTITFGILTGAVVFYGKDMIYYDISDFGWLYLVASSVLLVVAFDAWFYWYHRLLHWGPIYKHIHSVHHMTRTPHWLTQFNLSPLEQAFQTTFNIVILYFVPLHPAAIGFLIMVTSLKTITGHSGREVYPRSTLVSPWLSWSTTVTHHEQHHSERPCNYSFFFTWWDRWFGTEHPNYSQEFYSARGNMQETGPGFREALRAH